MAYGINCCAYKWVSFLLAIFAGALIAVSILDDEYDQCDRTLVDVYAGLWSGGIILLSCIVGLVIGPKANRTVLVIHFILAILASLAAIGAIATGAIRFVYASDDGFSGLIVSTDLQYPIICAGAYPLDVYPELIDMCKEIGKNSSCCSCRLVMTSVPGTTTAVPAAELTLDGVSFATHHAASALLAILGVFALISTLTSATFCCVSKVKEQPLIYERPVRIPEAQPPKFIPPPQKNYAPLPQSHYPTAPPQGQVAYPYLPSNGQSQSAYANQSYQGSMINIPRTKVY